MEENDKHLNVSNKTFTIIAVLIIILFASGVTIAFFNYTRTGGANTVSVGRISFTSSQETITFENVFPIDSTQAATDTTNSKTMSVTVTGDTDYANGLEYVITVSDVNLSVNNKQLPIALEVSVANNSNLGTAETGDYYANRNNYSVSKYKVEYDGNLKEGSHILVGWIAPNATAGTPSGISGTINIKAYVDKDRILISDTYPEGNVEINNVNYYNGTTNPNDKIVFTTSEWNAITGNNALSFKIKVEANEGIWVEKYLSPDALIRKVKEDIDRTTQINFAYNSGSSNGQGVYILPGTENDANPIYYYRGEVNDNNVIFGGYCWQMVRTTDTGGIKMIYNGETTGNGETCENTTAASRQLSSTAKFNTKSSSMSFVGYMYNSSYDDVIGTPVSGAYFGTSAEYGEYDINNPGTNVYRLVDDGNGSVGTTYDANHHYSCNKKTADGVCTTIRYYYLSYRLISLAIGQTLEDKIYKFTGNIVNQNIDVVGRNQGYVLNNTNSPIKTAIENWFRSNLTNEVDTTKMNYVNYLEDTIYCNDRSFKTVVGNTNYSTYEQSGWNPNGGDVNTGIHFGTWNRYKNSWYSTSNVPTTVCPNETDRFTVSSTIAHLNYPVGLLTADEIIMAGAAGNSSEDSNTSYYLYTGGMYWSMSPGSTDNASYEFIVSGGNFGTGTVTMAAGVRPVVSLKPGIEFESGGEGTTLNPYVVKYD